MQLENIYLAIAIVLSALVMADESGTSPSETMGSFVATAPIQSTKPLIDHCISAAPASSVELQSEYSIFREKFAIAIEPLLVRLSSDPEFTAPVPDELKKKFGDMGKLMLSQIQQLDPNTYCTQLVLKMRGATSEGLRIRIEESLKKYESNARLN